MGTKEQVAIRQHLIEEIEADLIGPRIGNTKEKRSFEILPRNRSPENEYVAGVLFPGNWQVGDEEIDQEMADDDNDDNSSSNVSNDKLFKPSSFGLTCRLAPETKKIEIVSFHDLIDKANKEKEIELKYDLERNVKLVSFNKGKIDISFNEKLNKNFIKSLTEKLLLWTGERWIISLSKNMDAKSVFEKNLENKNNQMEEFKKSKIAQEIKKNFPDAKLIDIKKED